MKYTIIQKAHLMVLKGDYVACADYGEFVFITNGHYGYYVHKKDLLLDIGKLKQPRENISQVNPDNLLKNTVEAKLTRNILLLRDGRMAIKIATENGEKAWVNMKYLKEFGDDVNFRLSGEKTAIYVSDYKFHPLGVIMPIRITEGE